MDPVVNVPDDIKRDSRGLDEWSFKRHPSESKKPRKRGKKGTRAG